MQRPLAAVWWWSAPRAQNQGGKRPNLASQRHPSSLFRVTAPRPPEGDSPHPRQRPQANVCHFRACCRHCSPAGPLQRQPIGRCRVRWAPPRNGGKGGNLHLPNSGDGRGVSTAVELPVGRPARAPHTGGVDGGHGGPTVAPRMDGCGPLCAAVSCPKIRVAQKISTAVGIRTGCARPPSGRA